MSTKKARTETKKPLDIRNFAKSGKLNNHLIIQKAQINK